MLAIHNRTAESETLRTGESRVAYKATKKQRQPSCLSAHKAITFYRKTTWKWQEYFDVPKSKTSTARVLDSACAYARWVASKWIQLSQHYKKWNNELAHANRDFAKAALVANKIFPDISQVRLWYRASVEGGHGNWVSNKQGSGAGGWFQFMEGTYYNRSGEAFETAKTRGFSIPEKYNSWYSVLGQNITAAYMFHIGLECAGEGWAASC